MLLALSATTFLGLTTTKAFAQNTGADAVLGVWKNGEGTGLIQITKRDNKYYGKIVWLKVANDVEGKPRTDINNPEEGLRNRPLKGMENMRDFIYAGDNRWEDGRIYDPKNGNDYSCHMTLTGPNTLEVRGFIGISLLGRTDIWTRQVKKG
jgi:uncharacterized protein (DUF2147 family)